MPTALTLPAPAAAFGLRPSKASPKGPAAAVPEVGCRHTYVSHTQPTVVLRQGLKKNPNARRMTMEVKDKTDGEQPE